MLEEIYGIRKSQSWPKVAQTAKLSQSDPKWPRPPERTWMAQSDPKFRPLVIALNLKSTFFWDTLFMELKNPNSLSNSGLGADTLKTSASLTKMMRLTNHHPAITMPNII